MQVIRNKKINFYAVIFVAALLLLLPGFVRAKEVWTQARTQNFEFVGNAPETQIRDAARNLEQFREFFRLQFPHLNLKSALPVRVVIFASSNSYRQFQPLRADGSVDAAAVGYFQAGLDANYIAFPLGDKPASAPHTIYHEYVHFIVHNNLARGNVPAWLNEGLAEYFQTFRTENGSRARLGEPQQALLRLLESESLIPFDVFLTTDNFALKNQGNHGRTVFYAQSWALVHYLQTGARRAEFDKFLALLLAGKSSGEAFQLAFQTNRAGLEKELREYLTQKRFATIEVESKPYLPADSQIQTDVISESAANTILGNLLLQQNRFEEASALFEKALDADAANADARAALGVALARQKNFSAAETHFEKALQTGANGFLPPFFYAYALLKQETDGDRLTKPLSPAKTKKIRFLLNESVKANSEFAESYHLLALINLINSENLSEAVELLEKAVNLDGSNLRFVYDLGQAQLRLTNYDEAERLAKKVYETSADKNLRLNAQALALSARNIRDKLAALTEIEEIKSKEQQPFPVISQEEGLLQALNEALRKPLPGEQRLLGTLIEIECSGKNSTFLLQTGEATGAPLVFTAELQRVRMTTFAPDLEGRQIGCEAKRLNNFIVLTYRPTKESKAKSAGEVISIEFVPNFFRFLSVRQSN